MNTKTWHYDVHLASGTTKSFLYRERDDYSRKDIFSFLLDCKWLVTANYIINMNSVEYIEIYEVENASNNIPYGVTFGFYNPEEDFGHKDSVSSKSRRETDERYFDFE